MPIYEYQCNHCRYYLEVIQKINDAKLKKCPSCGRNALRKLISAPVFRLKGSGWYETDFKSDQEQKRNLVAAEKEPAAADPKAGKDAKDAKDAKDSKDTATKDSKSAGETAADSKPAASEAKAASAASGKDTGKPSKSASRSKSTARRPSKLTRRAAPAAKSKRRKGRR